MTKQAEFFNSKELKNIVTTYLFYSLAQRCVLKILSC